MSRITVQNARGWVRTSKFGVDELDVDLCDQIETEVLSRIRSAYDTSTWINETTTPSLVRTAIAKMYVSWLYAKTYSEDEEQVPEYARALQRNAEMLITGIIDGTIELSDATPADSGSGRPSFYPDDTSSAQCPTFDDPSLGPAAFSMGKVF
jgi:hypothetical protein